MSSSDDDDDLLSGGPAFGKVARRKETNMLTFLDNMVEKEREKNDRRERIENLIKKKEEEEDEEDGEDGDGEDVDDDEDDEDGEEEDEGEECAKEGEEKEDERGENWSPDSDPIASASPPARRKTRAQTRSMEAERKEGGGKGRAVEKKSVSSVKSSSKKRAQEETCKKRKKKAASDQSPSKGRKGKAKKAKTIEHDEAYWSRIDSVIKDADVNLQNRARRMREITDKVERLGMYRPDSRGGAEDGHDEGEASAAMAEQRADMQERADAAIAGLSSSVGARPMFFAHCFSEDADGASRCAGEAASSYAIAQTSFSTAEAAMDELKAILRRWDGPPPKSWRADGLLQRWRRMREDVLQSLQSAIDMDMLPEYLERRRWCGAQSEHVPLLPKALLVWLLRMAISSREQRVGSLHLSLAAHAMALRVLRSRMALLVVVHSDLPRHDLATADAKALAPEQEGNILHLAEFVPMLRREFGLWPGHGAPPPSSKQPLADADDLGSNADEPLSSSSSSSSPLPRDAYEFSLKCTLEFWSAAFQNDMVDWRQDGNDEDFEDFLLWDGKEDGGNEGWWLGRTLALNLAMLVRIGVDPSFHSGHELVTARNTLITSMFHWVQIKHAPPEPTVAPTHGTLPAPYLQWIRHAAAIALTYCSNLSSGPPGSHDTDDTNGWLPISLAVRTCYEHANTGGGGIAIDINTSNANAEAVTTFYATLAAMAVRLCIHGQGTCTTNTKPNNGEWDKRLHQKATDLHHASRHNSTDNADSTEQTTPPPLRFQLLATAEAALSQIHDHLDSDGPSIKSDGPRYLATVETASICIHIAMLLFRIHGHRLQTKGDSTDDVRADANVLCQHLNQILDMCPSLKKVGSVIAFPHLRRVKEMLSHLERFYRYYGEIMGSSKGACKKGRRSGSILNYFVKEEEEEEDDDEDSVASMSGTSDSDDDSQELDNHTPTSATEMEREDHLCEENDVDVTSSPDNHDHIEDSMSIADNNDDENHSTQVDDQNKERIPT